MKKIFTPIIALIAATMGMSANDQYTFDFSNPETYGFAVPADGETVNLKDADTIRSGAAMFINEKNGSQKILFTTKTNYTQFKNEEGTISLLIQNKTVVKFEGDGRNIKKIEFKGAALDGAKTFDCGTFHIADANTACWTGDDSSVTLTNAANFDISSMTVTLGEASTVKYPAFSSNGDVLYAGVTTPKTITLTSAEEGATLYYKFNDDAEWTEYTEAGISVTESCVLSAKAVKGGAESEVVCASYTVNPTTAVASQSEFEKLAEGEMAVTTVPLTVVYHWFESYYSIVYATDGERIFNIDDRDVVLEEALEPGTVIKPGLAGSLFPNYMNCRPSFEMMEGTLVTDGKSTDEVLPVKTSISEIVANPSQYYNRYIALDGINMTFTKKNNYDLTDSSSDVLALFNRFSTLPADMEDGKYNISGFLVNNGSADQFYPVSVEAVPYKFTFDFSDPEAYGFDMPEEGSFTNVADADTLVSGAAKFINEKNGTIKSLFGTNYYRTQFQKNEGVVDLLIQRKTVVKFEGDGRNIREIEFKGSVLDGDKSFSNGYYYVANDSTAYWVGDDSIVTMTMGSPAEFRISSMTMKLGDASSVRYPEFSSTGDVLYADVTTPYSVTLDCETEGAELYYRINDEDEWTSYTEDGISISENCIVYAKAVKDGAESQTVCANYYVLPTYKVATQNEFAQLEEDAMAVTTAPLTVVYNWFESYYNVILATDGEYIFNINDRDLEIEDALAPGTIIKPGLAGSMFHTGYMSFKPSFELLASTLATDGISEEPVLPVSVSIDEIAANPEAYYNRYLKISAAELEFVKTNNYNLYDGSDTVIVMYDRFKTVPASLEDDRYDICGVLINNGTMNQFYPVSLEACAPVAILTGTVDVERTVSVGRATVGKVGLDWGDGEIVWQMTSVDEYWGDPVPAEFKGMPVEDGEIRIYGDGITYLEAYGNMQDGAVVNPLFAADVTNAVDLEELYLNTNSIESIDLSGNLKLKTLNLANNRFESIDITANTALTSFTADANMLTSVDLSKNAALTTVMLNNNMIATIDFSNNPLMKTFNCMNNELESVTIGKNTAKNHTLQFGGNKLSKIDLSEMTNISGAYLRLRDNLFTSAADIILPADAKVKQIWIDGNAMTMSQLYALKAKSSGAFTYATLFAGEYAQQPMEIAQAYDADETVDLSSENMLGETATVFTWITAAGDTLVQDVDYTVADGVFTFNVSNDSVRCSLANIELADFTAAKPFVTTWTSVQPTTKVRVVNAVVLPGEMFNLNGVAVDDNFSGIIILDGKKYIR